MSASTVNRVPLPGGPGRAPLARGRRAEDMNWILHRAGPGPLHDRQRESGSSAVDSCTLTPETAGRAGGPPRSDRGPEAKGPALGTVDATRWPHAGTVGLLMGLIDALLVLISGLAIYATQPGWDAGTYPMYTTTLLVSVLALIAASRIAGVYRFESLTRPTRYLPKLASVYGLIFVALVVVAFGLKISDQFSRIWLFSWAVTATTLVCVARVVYHRVLHRRAKAGRLVSRVVVVGVNEHSHRLVEALELAGQPWYRVVGIFDDRLDPVSGEPPFPIRGTVDDLVEFARKHWINEVIITLPWRADRRVREIVEKLLELPVHVRLSSDLATFMNPRMSGSDLAGIPMVELIRAPITGSQRVVKNVVDRLLAAVLLVVFAPFMALVAIAVRLDSPGPALFRDQRLGFNEKPFVMLKFRTMLHDPGDAGPPGQTPRDDPRITRLGRWLRKTSIDELPQLCNVITGSMSLVGPRPQPIAVNRECEALIPRYNARHRVKPGITGWAQAHGLRGDTGSLEGMKTRVEYDMYYIDNWSFWLDLRILVMTAYVVLLQENAF